MDFVPRESPIVGGTSAVDHPSRKNDMIQKGEAELDCQVYTQKT